MNVVNSWLTTYITAENMAMTSFDLFSAMVYVLIYLPSITNFYGIALIAGHVTSVCCTVTMFYYSSYWCPPLCWSVLPVVVTQPTKMWSHNCWTDGYTEMKFGTSQGLAVLNVVWYSCTLVVLNHLLLIMVNQRIKKFSLSVHYCESTLYTGLFACR